MYKKLLFGTCLTEYCEHIFNFALNLATENKAKLWIYHGLGRLNASEDEIIEKIKEGERRVAEAYKNKLRSRGFTDYMINISNGDEVSEMCKLAKNAGMDAIIIGTSTSTPLEAGEGSTNASLGDKVSEILLKAPCSVIVVPPSLLPGLAQG